MDRRVLCSSLILCSFVVPIVGQQPQQPPPQQSASKQQNPPRDDEDVVRITTNLVQVDVVVTKDGKQMTDLKPEDFELFEDGHLQKITNFSYISNVPGTAANNAPVPLAKDKSAPVVPAAVRPRDVRRTVALVVDDLGMSNESMGQARRQLRKFVDEQLQPNDLVAIIRTGGEVGALQQFTTDKRLLHSAIEHLKWNHCSRTGVNVFKPATSTLLGALGDVTCGGQALAGTMRTLRFVLQGMRELPGRKSMVLFSDYIPIQDQEPGPSLGGTASVFSSTISYAALLQRVAELAIRASVVIYAVDTRGLAYTGPTAADKFSGTAREITNQIQASFSSRSQSLLAGREGSDLIARQTGGFLVRNSNDFGIERVMDDQRGYYLIGYRPGDQTFNRRFHHIKARVKRGGLTLRTRDGFYGVTEDEARLPELVSRDKMNLALMSPFGGSDINLRLTTFFANESPTGSLLRSFLYLDARDLTFTDKPDGTHEATFALSSVVFGDNGKVLSQQDLSATLRLSQGSYERAQREGIVYSFDMPVKGFGAFQFRVAVRDQTSARIGAAGQFVEVPNLLKDQLALSGIVIHSDDKSQAQPSSNDPARPDEGDTTAGPAVRQFHQGANLIGVYAVYNALLDKTTHLPRLTTQTRIFRDGKSIFTGDPTPLDLQGQTDLQRLIAGSRLYVGPDLSPGDYVLQITVEDHLGKEKTRIATQWIDFEVVK
jgi:VWFA-related protein